MKRFFIITCVSACISLPAVGPGGARPTPEEAADEVVDTPIDPPCDVDIAGIEVVTHNYYAPEGHPVAAGGLLLGGGWSGAEVYIGLRGLPAVEPIETTEGITGSYDWWDVQGQLVSEDGRRVLFSPSRNEATPDGQLHSEVNLVNMARMGGPSPDERGLTIGPSVSRHYACSCDPVFTLELRISSPYHPGCVIDGRWEHVRVAFGSVDDPYLQENYPASFGCQSMGVEVASADVPGVDHAGSCDAYVPRPAP